MRYLMLVCRDPAIELTPEDRAAMRDGVVAWVDEMEGRGILPPGGHELRAGQLRQDGAGPRRRGTDLRRPAQAQ